MRAGALDFLAFFASFWGNAKKKEWLITEKLSQQERLFSEE